MNVMHDVKYDFNYLKEMLECYPIDQFIYNFNRTTDKYINSDFDPDSYFPNKVHLNGYLSAIVDNIRSAIILGNNHIPFEEYRKNLEDALRYCRAIKEMPWAKVASEQDWSISTDEIRINVSEQSEEGN